MLVSGTNASIPDKPAKKKQQKVYFAEIIKPLINLREGPSMEDNIVRTLKEGEKIKVDWPIVKKNRFIKVDGGYIREDLIKIVG